MDWHDVYLALLSALFVFWNRVRILTYVPTIRKLMHPAASGRDYSLATWGSWVCSNGFFALYLWEHGGRRLDAMVLLNGGNTCMCLITCYFIVKLRRRPRRGVEAPDGPSPIPGARGYVRPPGIPALLLGASATPASALTLHVRDDTFVDGQRPRQALGS